VKRARYTPRAFLGGRPLEAHGGYLVRLESFLGLGLVRLAREALVSDGVLGGLGALRVSVHRRRKLVRLAYEGLPGAQRHDALWYNEHHALARLLSRAANATVHTYVFEPSSHEEVIAYGNGRRVGGDKLAYEDVELPEGGVEMDDAAFAQMRSRWPLGHLAYVFGLKREDLLRLPWATTRVVLSLDAVDAEAQLEELLPSPQLSRVTPDAA
jgi:hypothetical protein